MRQFSGGLCYKVLIVLSRPWSRKVQRCDGDDDAGDDGKWVRVLNRAETNSQNIMGP